MSTRLMSTLKEDEYGVYPNDSFLARSSKLMIYIFKSDGILSKRLPHFYGPHCTFTYLYKLYAASFAGFLLAGEFRLLALSAVGFVVNALAVTVLIGWYGGLTKFASIPHLVALGVPTIYVACRFVALPLNPLSLSWLSCVASLMFCVPVTVLDFGELHQVFVQKKYFVLMPSGVVHPLKTWLTVDKSVSLDMSVMFRTAIKLKE